jgi:sulfur-carrier protein
MRIQLKFFADLRPYLPTSEGALPADLPEGATVADVLRKYAVPEEKPKILLVNGRHAQLSDVLQEGDLLSVFPPVAGG